jgi:predicted transcriptional regulator
MALSAAELYALVLSALNYLQDDGGQFRKGTQKAGLTREEFWLLNRFRYFPGSVAPGDFLTFGPYASVSTYEQQLDSLVAKKFAEAVDTGRYRLAEAGRKLVEQLYRDYYAAIARHDRLNDADVQRLGTLADRVVAFLVRQPDVPSPITNAARSAFPEITRPWVYTERRVTALAVFRDDAHIAAWREDGWNGPRIAVSTALFKAAQPLPYVQLRAAVAQLNDKDFKSVVSALHSGGEVTHNVQDIYKLTPAGRHARQAVEEMTDHNYAVLFNALSSDELKELVDLLEQVRGPAAD